MKWRKPTKINFWDKYGKLTLIKEVYGKSARYIQCKCDCWNIVERNLSSIIRWRSNNCWCYQKEIATKTFKTHWMYKSRFYNIYRRILNRCNNKNHKAYKNYGWRWIKCEWKNFEEFYNDMKDWYSNILTIDRVNNNWAYCESNCKWSTKKEQSRNRRDNVFVTIDWKTKLLIDWCVEFDIKIATVYSRIHKWWDKKKAILTPKLR